MMRRRVRAVSGLCCAGATVLTLLMAACKPWTVRAIEEEPASAAGGSAVGVSPADYVTSIWDAKVVPTVMAQAVDLAQVLKDGPASTNLLVKGTATVVRLDTRSRVGLAYLDLLPTDGRVDAALQIGPVVRGTALRDALRFVRFEDFVNQIEFADIATALNDHALRSALQSITPDTLKDRTVSFTGAVRVDARQTGALEIVPVMLSLQERTR